MRRLVMRRLAATGVVLAVGALAGCGGSGSHHPAAATTTTTTSASTTTVASSTTSSSVSAPPTTVAVPAGGPVPAGFLVQSATFISADQGWVLGTAPCAQSPCTSMARTTDGAAHWVGVPAPRDALATAHSPSPSGVSEVRFADALNGWVFGPDLWSTHNGGATWARVAVGSAVSQVVALEASSGEVNAVVTDCATTSQVCPGQLWHAPVGSDHFTQVTNVTLAAGVAGPESLALHGSAGYVIGTPPSANGSSSASPLFSTTNGTTWVARTVPCPATVAVATIAPVTVDQAVMLCAGEGAGGSTAKSEFVTNNAGATWAPFGQPAPRGGDGGTIAAASSSTVAIATSSAAAEIYLSTNGGSTWITALQLSDGGIGFGDFGFTTATRGFVVHAPAVKVDQGDTPSEIGPDPGTLFTTTNAGTTWHPSAI